MLDQTTRQNNLWVIARIAVQSERAMGVPALVTAAQAIVESGWLEHCPGNNVFGVKALSSGHPDQLLDTTEWFTDVELKVFLSGRSGREAHLVPGGQTDSKGRREYRCKDWFRLYASLQEAFNDHARLLMSVRYRDAWWQYDNDRDLQKFVENISREYSTSAEYARTVMVIAGQQTVQEAIQKAKDEIAAAART